MVDQGGFPYNKSLSQVPLNSVSPGTVGQTAVDSAYFYACVYPNYWRRTTLSDFGGILGIKNLVSRYKASDFDATADATEISAWNDVSGNGVTYAVSAAGGTGNRPIVARNAINGTMTAVRDNAHLGFTGGAANILATATGYTVFMVMKQVGLGYSCGLDDGSATGWRAGITQNQGAGTNRWEITVPNFGNFYSNEAQTLSSWFYIAIVGDNTATPKITVYVNGTALTWISNPNAILGGTTSSWKLNYSPQSGNCDNSLAEYLLYSVPLGLSDRQTLESYAKSTYGL